MGEVETVTEKFGEGGGGYYHAGRKRKFEEVECGEEGGDERGC